MGKTLALNHWANQESHYTAPRIQFGGYSPWSQVTDCFHPSAWTFPILSMAEHTSSNSSILALLKDVQLCLTSTPLSTSYTPGHNKPTKRELVSRVQLYCAVQKSLEPFWDRHHWREGAVKSILHCSLVHQRSHTWDTKKLLHLPALWLVSFPFVLISLLGWNTAHMLPPKWLKIWSWVRILGPYKPNVWLCYRGTVIILDAKYWGIGKT